MKLFFFILSCFLYIGFSGCSRCMTGGKLVINEAFVSNSCGLLNGVSVSEISVDSFSKNIPIKYMNKRTVLLYKQGASPEKMPKKLFYSKDCEEIYIWKGEEIVDTLQSSFKFLNGNWYRFYSMDSHEEIFMHIDSSGKKALFPLSNKVSLDNW